MSEFFGRLEADLRAAAERPPRRAVPVSAIAVACLLALAVAPIVLVLGSGDEAGAPDERSAAETPEAPQRPDLPGFPGAEVVATGTSPVAGPWEILSYRSERLADPETGEVHQPAGLRCLGLRLLDPPSGDSSGLSGQCGEFPRTPGFSRIQLTMPNVTGGAGEILLYGRVPEEAASVRVTFDGRAPVEVEPIQGPRGEPGDFYVVVPVPPDTSGARVNWIDNNGNEGSPGIELLPP
jgi:hypothetical protein